MHRQTPAEGISARNLFYAFGHGHLGLTQAASTGRLTANLIRERSPDIDIAPSAIRRFNR